MTSERPESRTRLERAIQQQRFGRGVSLGAEEIDRILGTSDLCRVATSRGDTAHVTPMWFWWDGSALWLYSIVKSKRWRDLMANPRVAVVIDSGSDFSSYRGLEIKGRVRVVGTVPRTATPDPSLAAVENAFARKYNDSEELAIDGRHAWLCLEPDTVVSWDFGKLLDLRAGVAFRPAEPPSGPSDTGPSPIRPAES